MYCQSICIVYFAVLALWVIAANGKSYLPTTTTSVPSITKKVDTRANVLRYMSALGNAHRVVIQPHLLPKSKENCTKPFHVYITQEDECRPQVALHEACRYMEQCDSIVPRSVCDWKSDTENYKTCQCPPTHMPSGRSTSCIPKRKCQSGFTSTVKYEFNPVEPERSSCRANEVCLKDNTCICAKGYEMDDDGYCVQLEHFGDTNKNIHKVSEPKFNKNKDNMECKAVLQQVRKEIQSKYDKDLEQMVEIRVKEAIKEANEKHDQTLKNCFWVFFILIVLVGMVASFTGYMFYGYRRNKQWKQTKEYQATSFAGNADIELQRLANNRNDDDL